MLEDTRATPADDCWYCKHWRNCLNHHDSDEKYKQCYGVKNKSRESEKVMFVLF